MPSELNTIMLVTGIGLEHWTSPTCSRGVHFRTSSGLSDPNYLTVGSKGYAFLKLIMKKEFEKKAIHWVIL
jgi:hypothetical protein